MARNRFEVIRAAFQIHAPDSVSAERCDQDPLCHSRRLMAQIQKKFATIAVPVGAVSRDENTVRTKARSSARTYLPSKPDKYRVRFYAVMGWEGLYAYSIWDNGSGNRTRATPAERRISRSANSSFQDVGALGCNLGKPTLPPTRAHTCTLTSEP
ncbi:LOW QUALITY PROTEIN: hypothetical protein PHMEG_00039850 [Phytophthora megakarya]|uniref:PiggyBac transposable element-derived protein domain-containing protein n=1 Tax=Phytophthora megakarya TaxID=4795 RepID=A0A225UER1_9STRA|nr:LOW QUALITY PROTEIN: hypothetical protein PHMEG_00039850 [Phytophthora megakarya]